MVASVVAGRGVVAAGSGWLPRFGGATAVGVALMSAESRGGRGTISARWVLDE